MCSTSTNPSTRSIELLHVALAAAEEACLACLPPPDWTHLFDDPRPYDSTLSLHLEWVQSMSNPTLPGLEAAGEQLDGGVQGKGSGTPPERHDSKVDNPEQTPAEESAAGLQTASDNENAVAHNASILSSSDEHTMTHRPRQSATGSTPLQIRTNVEPPTGGSGPRLQETPSVYETPTGSELKLQHSLTSPISAFPTLGSSLRSALSSSSMASSPGSNFPSPYLAGMSDLTPLPSPMPGVDLPAVYRKALDRPTTPSRSRAGSLDETFSMAKPSSPTSAQKRKKPYGGLLQGAVETSASKYGSVDKNGKYNKRAHSRNRSISDFVPETLHNTRPRNITLGSEIPSVESQEHHMQREANVAVQRGVVASEPTTATGESRLQIPTPPASSSSVISSDDADDEPADMEDGSSADYLEIHCGIQNKRRKFRQLRQLGEGTFSKVMLATRQKLSQHPTPDIERYLDPHKLVAVKIVEHGPAGGADEQRIETGLRREVEMLKSISHPSLVHLKACEYQSTRTLLVLTYCPGGDLFELASQQRDLLGPQLIQRMFSELVSAVRYLHHNWIVHRDIKLENVLVNIPRDALQVISNPTTHPTAIVTLTDLGLSRRIPDPPESPLLQTRCGSEDYAAPEILLGQPYDGRATDAWALGVLLYALMEGRLPFDTPPGKPERSRNTHRIARCDWIWCRFGDEEGDWEGPPEYEGAKECVEGVLKKVRMGRKGLDVIEGMEWVKDGVRVEGGLRVREEDEDEL